MVTNYQTGFESLATRVIGLPPRFFLSCFIRAKTTHKFESSSNATHDIDASNRFGKNSQRKVH